MRFEGRIKSWNAERGFGFIEPDGGGQQIFLHLSAVPTLLRPPRLGQPLTFEVQLNRDGKKRAGNVGVTALRDTRGRARSDRPADWNAASALAIPAFVTIFVTLAITRGVSLWFALAYVVLSMVCLMAYAWDKSAAIAGRWRSTERSLLVLGLIGGWPGGLIAQQLLRHKSSKAAFRQLFWGTVLMNVAAFVFFHVYLRPAWHA